MMQSVDARSIVHGGGWEMYPDYLFFSFPRAQFASAMGMHLRRKRVFACDFRCAEDP